MIKNKFKNISILFLTLFIFTIFNLTKAYGVSSNEMLMDSRKNIASDKVWKIKLNKSIDKKEALEKNIYVMDENEKLFTTSTNLNSQGTEIQVIPTKKYVYGKKYNLYIKDVKSKDGNSLKHNVNMPFTIMDKEVVEIKNTKELLENIGPNKTLILKAGDYNLLEPQVIDNKYIKYEEVFDGIQITIRNLDNLTIKGEEGSKVQLLVEPRYANVLSFDNCNNIKIENIIAGHYPHKGSCTGGVLYFSSCKDVSIKNADLFGCGTMGIILDFVQNLVFDNSVIRDCSYGIMEMTQCKNIKFNQSDFRNCREFDLITVRISKDVEFNECNIHNNTTENVEYGCDSYLFHVDPTSKVIVNKGSIKNNSVKDLVENKERVIFNNVDIKDNVIFNVEDSRY